MSCRFGYAGLSRLRTPVVVVVLVLLTEWLSGRVVPPSLTSRPTFSPFLEPMKTWPSQSSVLLQPLGCIEAPAVVCSTSAHPQHCSVQGFTHQLDAKYWQPCIPGNVFNLCSQVASFVQEQIIHVITHCPIVWLSRHTAHQKVWNQTVQHVH